MSRHARLPWRVHEGCVFDANGDPLIDLYGDDPEADAKLIVCAVNAHESMAKTLREVATLSNGLVKTIEVCGDELSGVLEDPEASGENLRDAAMRCIDRFRSALDRAEGGTS